MNRDLQPLYCNIHPSRYHRLLQTHTRHNPNATVCDECLLWSICGQNSVEGRVECKKEIDAGKRGFF